MKVKEFSTFDDMVGFGELELDHSYFVDGGDSVMKAIKADAYEFIRESCITAYDWLYSNGYKESAYKIADKLCNEFIKTVGEELQAVDNKSKPVKALMKILARNGIKIESPDAAGQVAGKLSDYVKRYGIGDCVVQVTKDFSWKPGDFGDNGSCFFSSRSYTRKFMEKTPNFFGVLIGEKDPIRSNGIGRCWATTMFGGVALFNVYSKVTGDFTLQRVARMLLPFLDSDAVIHNMKLVDDGATDSAMYINSNGSSVLISKKETVRKMYDMRTGLKHSFVCEECVDIYPQEYEVRVDGRSYCIDCYNELFDVCRVCRSPRRKSRLTNGVCKDCLEVINFTCHQCGRELSSKYKTSSGLCTNCAPEVVRCLMCGSILEVREVDCSLGIIPLCGECRRGLS